MTVHRNLCLILASSAVFDNYVAAISVAGKSFELGLFDTAGQLQYIAVPPLSGDTNEMSNKKSQWSIQRSSSWATNKISLVNN